MQARIQRVVDHQSHDRGSNKGEIPIDKVEAERYDGAGQMPYSEEYRYRGERGDKEMVSLRLQSGCDEGIVGSGGEKVRDSCFPQTSCFFEVKVKEIMKGMKSVKTTSGRSPPTTPTQGHQYRRRAPAQPNVGANLCSCTNCQPSAPSGA